MNIRQNSSSPTFEWFWKLILKPADLQYHSLKTEQCGLQHHKQSDAEITIATEPPQSPCWEQLEGSRWHQVFSTKPWHDQEEN